MSERAVEEAIYVCFIFSVVDRLADAFDYDNPEPKYLARAAWIFRRIGYKYATLRR